MEDNKNLYPPLPTNYVTIVDLQNRWLQQKQQQQQQQEEEKHIKKEKFEHNHNLSNKIIDKQVVKSNSQFQKFNRPKPHLNPNLKPRSSNHGKIHQKKQAEELKKVSGSSEINGGSANRIEGGDCEEKSSRFRKPSCYRNPNFGNRKLIYRNFDGKKRLTKEFNVVKNVSNVVSEESKVTVAVNSIEIDDRKVEDEKKGTKKKKKRAYKKKMKNRKNEERENLVDDRTVEVKGDQVVAEDRTVEVIDDRTVEEKDDQVIAQDQKVEVKDDHTVEKKEVEVIVDDQTVEEKENEVIVEDRTVEEKENEVNVKDRTAEIEEKLKEVLLMNGRSTTEIEGGRRREYGSYGRGYRRGYNYGRGYRRGYNYGRRNWGMGRGGNVTVDGFYGRGRSTVVDGGWGGVYRGYGGGENRGRGFGRRSDLVWVKKNGDCV